MKKHYYISYCYQSGSSHIDKKKLYIGCNKAKAERMLKAITESFDGNNHHMAWMGEYFNGQVMNDTGDYHNGWREVSTLRIHNNKE